MNNAPPTKKVLVCIDGSDGSKRALDYVCEFGRKEHEFLLYSAVERSDPYMFPPLPGFPDGAGMMPDSKQEREVLEFKTQRAQGTLNEARRLLTSLRCGFKDSQVRTVVDTVDDARKGVSVGASHFDD